MKRKKTFIGALIIIALTSFIACSQNEEPSYSCNPKANAWVKSNIRRVKSMNRKDWKKFDANYRLGAYRAFTPKQKLDFWKDKFEELNQMQWSPAEKIHLAKALAFIVSHADFFSEKKLTDDQLDELELFFHKWKDDAIKHFGWSEHLCNSIVADGNSVLNKKGDIDAYDLNLQPSNPNAGFGPIKRDCDCSVKADFCYGASPCVKTSTCNGTDFGCGIVWLMDCTGRCAQTL